MVSFAAGFSVLAPDGGGQVLERPVQIKCKFLHRNIVPCEIKLHRRKKDQKFEGNY